MSPCVPAVESFPVRIVVVDNSGSMNSMDGNRLIRMPNGEVRSISSTRWAELGDVIREMGEAVSALQAETHFHMLNPTTAGQYFVVAPDPSGGHVGRAGAPADVPSLKAALDTSPMGTTPLTEAVVLAASLIEPAADKLRAHGQQVVVVLATDGLPNDPQSFLRALQQLQRLPVWLVVRLCTDEDAVVQYWSDLDAQLEAPLETLDDVAGEAKEIRAANPWLTYAPSLHLARTMGPRPPAQAVRRRRRPRRTVCAARLHTLDALRQKPRPRARGHVPFVVCVRAAQGCVTSSSTCSTSGRCCRRSASS